MRDLPTAPGSVVRIDTDYLMCTKFGNWVTEGVFVLGPASVEEEPFVVVFDADDPWADLDGEAPNV